LGLINKLLSTNSSTGTRSVTASTRTPSNQRKEKGLYYSLATVEKQREKKEKKKKNEFIQSLLFLI